MIAVLTVTRLLDLLSLTKRCEESKSGCDRHQVIAWAVQLRVDFADCKTSLSHHGRQISESESEAQAPTGESQKRYSEETATGLSRQGGAEKEVDAAAKQHLGSLGDSARLSWGEGDLQGFDNEVRGSGRHGQEHMRQCGRRASFNGADGISDMAGGQGSQPREECLAVHRGGSCRDTNGTIPA